MPKKNNRKGGFVKSAVQRIQLKNNDLTGRSAPEGLFRVVSINKKTQTAPQQVWIEGTYGTFLDAKKVADDKCGGGVVCYIHGNGPRVLYIAR
tara:strand:+ start:612 stop:890 length:279 start_codon:yes stop_codon:yes gene_type:complete